MADNIAILNATGATVTVRSKDVATVQTQQYGNEAASQVDGHSVTLGATTDARWTGTGNATLIAALKDVALLLRGTLAVSGIGGTQFAEDAAHTSGDLGTMLLAVRTDTAAVLSSATGDYTPLQTDDLGQLRVAAGQIIAQTSGVTRVAAAATSTALLAANANRIGATIMNDSSSICYLKLGATASSTSFTAKLAPNDANGIGGYYEVPSGYTDVIHAIWPVAAGAAAITELS